MEKNKELAEMAKKVMKKLKEAVEKKGLKLSVTESGKEGKSKMTASRGFLEDELRQCSKEGVTMTDSVETLVVDSRTRVKSLGSQRKSEEEEVQGEILAYQQEQGLPKELHEGESQETYTSGNGASKDVESSCSGNGSHRKSKLEEADGSSSGQKEYDILQKIQKKKVKSRKRLKWKWMMPCFKKRVLKSKVRKEN